MSLEDTPLTTSELARLAPWIIAIENHRINNERPAGHILYIAHGLPLSQQSHAWLTLIEAAKATQTTPAKADTRWQRIRKRWRRTK